MARKVGEKRPRYIMTHAQKRMYDEARNQKVSARYWYMVDVLGAPRWKARLARNSVAAMKAAFPDHEFPAELLALGKGGPKIGAVYDQWSQKPVYECINEHGAVVYDGLYQNESTLIAKQHGLESRRKLGLQ